VMIHEEALYQVYVPLRKLYELAKFLSVVFTFSFVARMVNERLGNPPQGKQEHLVVKDKVAGRPTGAQLRMRTSAE